LSGCAVYVAGFEEGATREDFEEALGPYGEIAKVVIRGNRGNFAFVTFTTPEAASQAVDGGATINGEACKVELQV
jgi:hypothetical protein